MRSCEPHLGSFFDNPEQVLHPGAWAILKGRYMNRFRFPSLKLACTAALIQLLCACASGPATAPASPPALVHDAPDPSKGCQTDQVSDASLVGKTEAAAVALLKGCPWRIGERDGQQFPGTMDYDPTRRTLGIAAGKVIWVRRG
jgi:hypothetical protein